MTHIQSVKQVIRTILVLHEQLNVLEHLSVHRHFIVVPDGVLAKEVKFYYISLSI